MNPMNPMNKKPVKATGLFEEDVEEGRQVEERSVPVQNSAPVRLQNLASIAQTLQDTSLETGKETTGWLLGRLKVVCKNADLSNGKYAGKMGVVERVVEGGFGAEVRMQDTHDLILLDQDDCEPSVPRMGERARVVGGSSAQLQQYRGVVGVMVEQQQQGGAEIVLEVVEPRNLAGRRLAFPRTDICTQL